MLCPKCGFYCAQQKRSCLKCGHTLNAKVYRPLEKKRYLIDADVLRIIIYLGFLCFIYLFFYKLYYFYVEAQNNRADTLILQQIMNHKEMLAMKKFEKRK